MSTRTATSPNATSYAGFPPEPPEAHQRANDVLAALTKGGYSGLWNTLFQYLPLFAKVAIDRLDADESLRTWTWLDTLLQAYAEIYCMTVDLETCAAAHQICARRFGSFQAAKVLC